VYTTCIEANGIQKKNGSLNSLLSDEDKRKIRDLSNDPQVKKKKNFNNNNNNNSDNKNK
jgi:hypothetical protein